MRTFPNWECPFCILVVAVERGYMDTSFDFFDETMIITTDKELDQHNADTIRGYADKYIYSGKVKNIIFDFEDTEFMDSSGIGVIMGRYKIVNGLGGKVYVVNVNSAVNRILELSGLYKIITKCESIDDVINN